MLTKAKRNRYNSFCLFGVIAMKVNIKDLAASGHPLTVKEELDVSGLLQEREGISAKGMLSVDLIARTEKGLTVVEGTLSLPVEMPCSRCLTPIRETLTVPFRELFALRPEIIPKEEQDEVHVLTEDHIMLEPYVLEAFWLALPYAPVCGEDCKGLCPTCGKNRNTEACGCGNDRIDPRMAGLADFFKT